MTMFKRRASDLKISSKGAEISEGEPEALRKSAISELLNVLKIPLKNRKHAELELSGRLGALSVLATHGSFFDNIERFERIGRLCKELLDEFHKLTYGGKYSLSVNAVYDEKRSETRFENYALDYYPRVIEELRTKVVKIERPRRAPNRPNGSIKYRSGYELITTLLQVAKRHGGELTLAKKARKAIGRLPDALKIAHDAMPSVIDSEIPYQTLRRMRQRAISEIEASEEIAPPSPEQAKKKQKDQKVA
jgi:hypothetical protein